MTIPSEMATKRIMVELHRKLHALSVVDEGKRNEIRVVIQRIVEEEMVEAVDLDEARLLFYSETEFAKVSEIKGKTYGTISRKSAARIGLRLCDEVERLRNS